MAVVGSGNNTSALEGKLGHRLAGWWVGQVARWLAGWWGNNRQGGRVAAGWLLAGPLVARWWPWLAGGWWW